eukprot:TRINITY_DN3300_c0_g3_i2.p1 TRINITY_DN3300_c0_g3~~TRINITY_DN3300_c0_g3_i2.p1  ORF type:complete len:370 (-),score=75.47 TRINITY_DN3300_c0_g3_i2:407-1489(-)
MTAAIQWFIWSWSRPIRRGKMLVEDVYTRIISDISSLRKQEPGVDTLVELLLKQRIGVESYQQQELITRLIPIITRTAKLHVKGSDSTPDLIRLHQSELSLKALMVLGECLVGAAPLAPVLADELTELVLYIEQNLLTHPEPRVRLYSVLTLSGIWREFKSAKSLTVTSNRIRSLLMARSREETHVQVTKAFSAARQMFQRKSAGWITAVPTLALTVAVFAIAAMQQRYLWMIVVPVVILSQYTKHSRRNNRYEKMQTIMFLPSNIYRDIDNDVMQVAAAHLANDGKGFQPSQHADKIIAAVEAASRTDTNSADVAPTVLEPVAETAGVVQEDDVSGAGGDDSDVSDDAVETSEWVRVDE